MSKYARSLWIPILLVFLGIAEGAGRWSRTGNLNRGRSGLMGAGLTDGRVMVVAGNEDDNGYEIFDPALGTWTRNLLPALCDHRMAILLYNGKVLWLAGLGSDVYLYEPRIDTWSASGANIPFAKRGLATVLKDGDVFLMTDGENCVLYRWRNDVVLPAGVSTVSRTQGVETLLPDGKVLLIGGGGVTCEIYDPGSGLSNPTGALNESREEGVGVLLRPPWQEVLVAGGTPNEKCELFDIATKAWDYTAGNLNASPRHVPGLALLPSGEVLLIGGGEELSASGKKTCELYDPATETWTLTDQTDFGRNHATTAILQTGKALVVGELMDNPTETEIYDPSVGAWAARAPLITERAAHTVTALPIMKTHLCSTNVLIVGGENSSGVLKTCELYNYCEEEVDTTRELQIARTHHTAVLLASGQVLVAGGKNGAALDSCELYTVRTETWAFTGTMGQGRYDHTASLLADGDALVTGGESAPGGCLSSCEVYSSGAWNTVAAMGTPRTKHAAVMLLNGDILVVGGQTTGGVATGTCELWSAGTWTPKASLSTARYWHSALLLQSGKVLVTGGTSDGSTPLATCEIYDPGANAWTAEGSLNNARFLHNSTLLYSGLVLTTGGFDGGTYLSSCEIWDPAAEKSGSTHAWKVTAPLVTARGYHASVLIPDHKPYIIAIGGNSGTYLNSIEEYDVGLRYRSEWQSTITNYPAVTLISDSMHIEGTLFRELSEADGGNYCHIGNNDHPLMSFVRVGGGNFQGNGGGDIMLMPHSVSWSTVRSDVVNLPAISGYYRLWSIVNGIPCKWCLECPHSVEENRRSGVQGARCWVYPNPATTSIEFRVQGNVETPHMVSLQIHDLSGRLVRSVSIHDSRFTIHGLKSGIYFYSIKHGHFEDRGKFIIAK